MLNSRPNGSSGRTRTYNPPVNSRMLYQLSYTEKLTPHVGAAKEVRTLDPRLGRTVLCQLSYSRKLYRLNSRFDGRMSRNARSSSHSSW